MRRESKGRCGAALRYPMTGDYGTEQEDDTENTRSSDGDLSGVALEHPQSHDDRDRDGHPDSENSPRAIRKRIHHDDAETSERDQKNKEHRDHGDEACERTDFGAGNLSQRAAAVAHRSHQHGKVLHTSGQHGTDQNPKKAGGKSELRGQSGPDQRPCSRDGGEVMAEERPPWRSNIVMAVRVKVRRSGAAIS